MSADSAGAETVVFRTGIDKGIPQAGRNGLPIPVRGGIKARTERYADRVRIIRATAKRDETRSKAASRRAAAGKTAKKGLQQKIKMR